MARHPTAPPHAAPLLVLALAVGTCSPWTTAAAAVAADSAPRTIWRCGATYSHQPCNAGTDREPGNAARRLSIEAAPTAQRQREALDVARREQALVQRWADERAQAWREAGSGLAGLGPVESRGLNRPKAARLAGKTASAPKPRATEKTPRTSPNPPAAARTSPSAAPASRRAPD